MKKSVLTIAASLLISSLTMATVKQGGNGEGDTDQDEATHGVEINIPTVALFDVESRNDREAGKEVDFGTATDENLWLNYTSIVTQSWDSLQREIPVELDNTNKLLSGVSL
ncbi:hypothetical protein GM418_22130 [Maribellus comscasis]|uniref:Uncharacterized protein n=1 Tax=Maribellus comscasis TaxID=2681766 RepID=A0A6I6JUP8_9BACT|nr:hypothetical protein [Maribellus comscasis]QGY46261.1 hypothetical protein GM418_22130 [Maribellus comscasis]